MGLFHRSKNKVEQEAVAMAATITGTATLDHDTYNEGDTMTLTVTRQGTDMQTLQETVTITLTAPDGTVQTLTAGPVSVTSSVSVATTVAVSDDSGRTWTQQSDNGTTAVFTATA